MFRLDSPAEKTRYGIVNFKSRLGFDKADGLANDSAGVHLKILLAHFEGVSVGMCGGVDGIADVLPRLLFLDSGGCA